MKLPQMPADVVGKGELEGSWWNAVAMLLLVVLAYLSVPLGLAVQANARFVISLLGIVAFFCLSFLFRQPARYLTVRTIGLLLIGAGIFAGLSFIRAGLELISINASRERSFVVSTVLLVVGLATLTAYWLLNFSNFPRNSANHSMYGSGGGESSPESESPPAAP